MTSIVPAEALRAETTTDGYEDAVSQVGIDIGEFVIDLIKQNPSMKLDLPTIKDVLGSTLASLTLYVDTLYVDDPDSPFHEERED